MAITYNKDGAYIEVTENGVVYRRAIRWEDCVVSVPGGSNGKVDSVYVNGSGQLVLVLEDESEITLARYTDAEALAVTLQAGAITDGVTKAPTHDAVYQPLYFLNGKVDGGDLNGCSPAMDYLDGVFDGGLM